MPKKTLIRAPQVSLLCRFVSVVTLHVDGSFLLSRLSSHERSYVGCQVFTTVTCKQSFAEKSIMNRGFIVTVLELENIRSEGLQKCQNGRGLRSVCWTISSIVVLVSSLILLNSVMSPYPTRVMAVPLPSILAVRPILWK